MRGDYACEPSWGPGNASAAPEWSVVVIARDEEQTIGRCLESLLAAFDGRSFELILVDSASGDRTVEIASRYPVRIVQLSRDAPLRPAVGRHVGYQLALGALILFVDGDCVLEPRWIDAAAAALHADGRLAGVAGASECVVVGAAGTPVMTGDQYPEAEYHDAAYLSGSALYRRAALARAGGFNPFMYGSEEMELGARLRKAGYRLERLPTKMTQHFPKACRETLPELLRRLRRRYPVGIGQLARQAIRHQLPVPHPFGRLVRPLCFLPYLILGGVALGAALWRGDTQLLCAWLVTLAGVFGAFGVRARSLRKPAYYFVEWAIMAPLVLYGFLMPPRSAAEFPALADVGRMAYFPRNQPTDWGSTSTHHPRLTTPQGS